MKKKILFYQKYIMKLKKLVEEDAEGGMADVMEEMEEEIEGEGEHER